MNIVHSIWCFLGFITQFRAIILSEIDMHLRNNTHCIHHQIVTYTLRIHLLKSSIDMKHLAFGSSIERATRQFICGIS